MNTALQQAVAAARKKISETCLSCGRDESEITLLAATKTADTDIINTLPEYNIYDAGENRVQSLLDKFDSLDPRLRLHFIGQLQTNKVKYIADKVVMIHSLDRVELAAEIQRQCQKRGKMMDVLIEINSSKEPTRGGVDFTQAQAFAQSLKDFPSLNLRGIMTVLPFTDVEKACREMQRLYIKFKSEYPTVDTMSMGMSEDFATAIRYGATMIRLGRLLFSFSDQT